MTKEIEIDREKSMERLGAPPIFILNCNSEHTSLLRFWHFLISIFYVYNTYQSPLGMPYPPSQQSSKRMHLDQCHIQSAYARSNSLQILLDIDERSVDITDLCVVHTQFVFRSGV